MFSWSLPSGAVLAAVILAGVSPARASDWPHWRGPALSGISSETGWSTVWPQEGPRQLWKTGVGIGFSSMAVADGRVFTMGNTNNEDTVFCFDAEKGAVLWKHTYPCGLRPQYNEGGPGATPTVDGSRVFTLSKEGHLFCFDAATGRVVWQRHVVQKDGVTMPRWGFAGSPLVHGDRLLLNVGSAGMAVRKDTGAVVWLSGTAAAGYATPVPLKLEGQDVVLIFAAKALVCAAVQDGRELWRYPWTTKWDLNIADPIVQGDRAFISSFDQGGAVLKFDVRGAAEVWRNQNLANHFNSCVLLDGFLYGVHGNTDRPPGEFHCVDFATGELKWTDRASGFGSVLSADGKLIVLSDKGELMVAPARPTGFQPVARAQVLGGKCWTTPVLANGRLFCRNVQGVLVALDLRDAAAGTGKAAEGNPQALFPADGVPPGWRVRAWADVRDPGPEGAAWVATNGVLHGSTPRGTWLLSEKEYGDFVLEFEWKLGERGNSGCALRTPLYGDPAFDGLELQMVDPRYYPPEQKVTPAELTGSLYLAVAPKEQVFKPTDWNRYQVTCRGPRVNVVLNGVEILDVNLDEQLTPTTRHDGSKAPPLKDRPRRGHIGFQELSRGGGHVEIRSARIRELE